MREAQDEENMKTRVKDIIRRDLLFYPTFRNALQGNTDRTARSLQYAELYDRYKDLYAPLLYEDPDDSDWSMDDREDSMFLEGYDPKRGKQLRRYWLMGSLPYIPRQLRPYLVGKQCHPKLLKPTSLGRKPESRFLVPYKAHGSILIMPPCRIKR